MVKRIALILATAALLVMPGGVAAHTAAVACGGTLTLAKGSATVDVVRTDVDPDVTVHNDAPGNGVYAVVPGTYKAVWSDGYVLAGLIVTSCAQTEATPTPTPEATPTPDSCGRGEGCLSPVPTDPCEAGPPAFDCGPFDTPRPNRPRPTLPPTDTAADIVGPSAAEYVVFLLAAVAGGALLLTGMANRKRSR